MSSGRIGCGGKGGGGGGSASSHPYGTCMHQSQRSTAEAVLHRKSFERWHGTSCMVKQAGGQRWPAPSGAAEFDHARMQAHGAPCHTRSLSVDTPAHVVLLAVVVDADTP